MPGKKKVVPIGGPKPYVPYVPDLYSGLAYRTQSEPADGTRSVITTGEGDDRSIRTQSVQNYSGGPRPTSHDKKTEPSKSLPTNTDSVVDAAKQANAEAEEQMTGLLASAMTSCEGREGRSMTIREAEQFVRSLDKGQKIGVILLATQLIDIYRITEADIVRELVHGPEPKPKTKHWYGGDSIASHAKKAAVVICGIAIMTCVYAVGFAPFCAISIPYYSILFATNKVREMLGKPTLPDPFGIRAVDHCLFECLIAGVCMAHEPGFYTKRHITSWFSMEHRRIRWKKWVWEHVLRNSEQEREANKANPLRVLNCEGCKITTLEEYAQVQDCDGNTVYTSDLKLDETFRVDGEISNSQPRDPYKYVFCKHDVREGKITRVVSLEFVEKVFAGYTERQSEYSIHPYDWMLYAEHPDGVLLNMRKIARLITAVGEDAGEMGIVVDMSRPNEIYRSNDKVGSQFSRGDYYRLSGVPHLIQPRVNGLLGQGRPRKGPLSPLPLSPHDSPLPGQPHPQQGGRGIMTCVQLRAIAASRAVPGRSRMNKAELVAALKKRGRK